MNHIGQRAEDGEASDQQEFINAMHAHVNQVLDLAPQSLRDDDALSTLWDGIVEYVLTRKHVLKCSVKEQTQKGQGFEMIIA